MSDTRINKINELRERIGRCKKCPLYIHRRNPVFGEGSINSRIMFIGEAPGRNEDIAGRPFVGSAGKLLDEVLLEVGLARNDIYITNTVKCRPPNNRTPYKEEIEACLPYLLEEISILSPKIIVTLGRVSGEAIYSTLGLKWRGIANERRVVKEVKYNNKKIKLLSTYHPAAALYKPELKEELRKDLRRVKEVLEEEGKERRKTLYDFFA